MTSLLEKGLGLWLMSIFGIFSQKFSSVTQDQTEPVAHYTTEQTPIGTTVIERFGTPEQVGITQSGHIATYHDPVFGRDAFAPVAISTSTPTQVGIGVHGNR